VNLTFGVLTAYEDHTRLNAVIQSIKDLNVPNSEVIVAGSYSPNKLPTTGAFEGVGHILTDGWITRKKNLIANLALGEVLVLVHDYYLFDKGWYRSYEKFGYDWDICSNPQFLQNGRRHFTDWVVWDSPTYPRYHSLCYDDLSQTKYQYISGGYFLVKRDFLQAYPLNEDMQPGSPEDVEWSLRVRDVATIKCNPSAIVRHNKRHRDCK
jgi:hypothetical protein